VDLEPDDRLKLGMGGDGALGGAGHRRTIIKGVDKGAESRTRLSFRTEPVNLRLAGGIAAGIQQIRLLSLRDAWNDSSVKVRLLNIR